MSTMISKIMEKDTEFSRFIEPNPIFISELFKRITNLLHTGSI